MCNDDFITIPYDAKLMSLASYFDCGADKINNFLRDTESLHPGYGKTYVFLSEDKTAIIGYYNISTAYLKLISEYGEERVGGSIHICYFALDKKYHGLEQTTDDAGGVIKLSDVLLCDCLHRIECIRNNHVGFSFVTLAATKAGESLYRRNGFEFIENDMGLAVEETEELCKQMYLALDYE